MRSTPGDEFARRPYRSTRPRSPLQTARWNPYRRRSRDPRRREDRLRSALRLWRTLPQAWPRTASRRFELDASIEVSQSDERRRDARLRADVIEHSCKIESKFACCDTDAERQPRSRGPARNISGAKVIPIHVRQLAANANADLAVGCQGHHEIRGPANSHAGGQLRELRRRRDTEIRAP